MATTRSAFEVNSFWSGGPLSQLEVLCLSSFVKNGATYNLYTYDATIDVPVGVHLRDAGEVVPNERMFLYPAGTLNAGSPSGFSNLFRYTLLQRTGGWWVDTDVCCLQPFPSDHGEFYLREEKQTGEFFVASCVFRAPPASQILQNCLDTLARQDLSKVFHGETGPALLTAAIRACECESAVHPGEQFLPVPWWQWERLFSDEPLPLEHGYAVHFWNTMLRAAGLDKNGVFAPESAFEELKRRYL